MIQIKCGNCKVLCNIDEDAFSARRNKNGYISDNPCCISCGQAIPYSFIRHILEIVDKNEFGGWEIGTHFEE